MKNSRENLDKEKPILKSLIKKVFETLKKTTRKIQELIHEKTLNLGGTVEEVGKRYPQLILVN